MRTVNLKFTFKISRGIDFVEYLTFETLNVDIVKYLCNSNLSTTTYSGTIEDFTIINDLKISLKCGGEMGKIWSLEVEIDGTKLTQNPITDKINENGTSTYFKPFALPN